MGIRLRPGAVGAWNRPWLPNKPETIAKLVLQVLEGLPLPQETIYMYGKPATPDMLVLMIRNLARNIVEDREFRETHTPTSVLALLGDDWYDYLKSQISWHHLSPEVVQEIRDKIAAVKDINPRQIIKDENLQPDAADFWKPYLEAKRRLLLAFLDEILKGDGKIEISLE